MKLKEIAKKLKLLYWVNSKFKSCQMKRDLGRLSQNYYKMAIANNLVYEPKEAIEEFKRRHRIYNPKFSARAPGDLRIFWVGKNQSQDESGFLQSLRRFGAVTVFKDINGEYGLLDKNLNDIEVSSFDEIREANAQMLLSQVARTQKEGSIDLLLGQMWARLIPKDALMKVQEMGIPIVNISMDDRLPGHWSFWNGLKLGSVGLSPGVDMTLTTSPETCLWFSLENCPALFWPLASDPEVFASGSDEGRDIDVLFIGNKYGVRGKIISYFKRRGLMVECYGNGWSNGYANAEQMASLSRRAKIILGVGTVGHCSDIYTLKLRDFDALMSGALYVTHRNPDLYRLFREGEEIEYYESPEEAYKKIQYFLEHPEERVRIGLKGQKVAISKHTWDVRINGTLRQLGFLN